MNQPIIVQLMMTSSNGNILCVTGLLCGEFTGHRRISRTKTSDAELWCFLWSTWIIGWVNNLEAGDLRRNRAHYDVTVMSHNGVGLPKPYSSFSGSNTCKFKTICHIFWIGFIIDKACHVPSHLLWKFQMLMWYGKKAVLYNAQEEITNGMYVIISNFILPMGGMYLPIHALTSTAVVLNRRWNLGMDVQSYTTI